MPKIILYGPRTGSSLRCHWALAEIGLPYDARKVDFKNGENKTPAFLAMNPAGQVPVMDYDGFILTESVAIVHYLVGTHKPELLGDNPQSRITGFRWELFVMLNIQPNLSTLASKVWGYPADEAATLKANATLVRFLSILEGWLVAHLYLAGDMCTSADIVARSTFHYAELAEFSLAGYPMITAWIARCSARPAYSAALNG
jgi:glutathione S-transferase